MKLIFATSDLAGSKLIRWTLGEDCSHMAVCFDDRANGSGIVFESIAGGAKLLWFGEFKKHRRVIHALSFKDTLTLEEEEAIYQGMLARYSGQSYDWAAMAFWVWHGLILWRIFGKSLPKKNAWAKSGYNLCTGLAAGVPWVDAWAKKYSIDLEMVGPQQLYRALLASGHFQDEQPWCDAQRAS